jgi:hypothetical protein
MIRVPEAHSERAAYSYKYVTQDVQQEQGYREKTYSSCNESKETWSDLRLILICPCVLVALLGLVSQGETATARGCIEVLEDGDDCRMLVGGLAVVFLCLRSKSVQHR